MASKTVAASPNNQFELADMLSQLSMEMDTQSHSETAAKVNETVKIPSLPSETVDNRNLPAPSERPHQFSIPTQDIQSSPLSMDTGEKVSDTVVFDPRLYNLSQAQLRNLGITFLPHVPRPKQ